MQVARFDSRPTKSNHKFKDKNTLTHSEQKANMPPSLSQDLVISHNDNHNISQTCFKLAFKNANKKQKNTLLLLLKHEGKHEGV